ncbi:hypothetical protein RCC89_09750 [Cytophagaceae bacterium ABcell3]|nr:hypothetical protein RCC89_09750 [Cytophagaceae bacterium ABcell3]
MSKKAKVKKEVDTVVDSMDQAWHVMMAADDRKLADIDRLIGEISNVRGVEEPKTSELQKDFDDLLQMRYQPESLTDEQIDSYDLATDKVIKKSFELIEETEELEDDEEISELQKEIMDEDKDVVLYRARYDEWAYKYNKLIDDNQKRLERSGDPYNRLKKRKLFRLEP